MMTKDKLERLGHIEDLLEDCRRGLYDERRGRNNSTWRGWWSGWVGQLKSEVEDYVEMVDGKGDGT